MENLAQKVLQFIVSNPKEWDYWTHTQRLAPVSQAPSIQSFVDFISTHKDEKIFVGGDYDCDGILATTIMVHGLRRYGIEVGYYIPDRIREGYGLHPQTVQKAHAKGYTTIITVDNGVKAIDALEKAKSYGMTTIVTDHHEIENPVPCDLLVHPTNMEPVFSTLCGAGVAFECIRALGLATGYDLELAAIASIGDVMIVKGQTRAIIQQGLKRLNEKAESHISPLANDRQLNEVNVGFQIVPKLNAVGRLSNLGNVNTVVRYFLCSDRSQLFTFQQQINQLNDRRKDLSMQMVNHAKAKCALQEEVLLVSDASYHEGIIGLVAGNLCNAYHKPAIVMTKNQEGYKASMRSPEGFNCMAFLKDFPSYATFGGHAQAAGFSLSPQDYTLFKKYIHDRIQTFQWEEPHLETLSVLPEELSLSAIQSLDQLRPFGPGFVCPSFELIHPEIQSMFPIQNGKHVRYILRNGLECMNFNQTEQEKQKSVNQIYSFVGQVQINQFRGQRKPSFIIETINYIG
ncbi:single-stranded-DNA-specific exonuclease RecJ [Absicoccus intestinalis]|uniref:Single-stranded-DNA-specific exonuclease RecJ n=1 Tax=Absicoccus intestinalis TaxID=2926319 RepID=A0ABU4WN60_9FIRM|nr:DHH family phosphoesterase [Absicoccus sp. CLA-KB-P134]MDX8417461.1 DHH family phosphoesterase [Absicoccus sp. CLA-KB-P134]